EPSFLANQGGDHGCSMSVNPWRGYSSVKRENNLAASPDCVDQEDVEDDSLDAHVRIPQARCGYLAKSKLTSAGYDLRSYLRAFALSASAGGGEPSSDSGGAPTISLRTFSTETRTNFISSSHSAA